MCQAIQHAGACCPCLPVLLLNLFSLPMSCLTFSVTTKDLHYCSTPRKALYAWPWKLTPHLLHSSSIQGYGKINKRQLTGQLLAIFWAPTDKASWGADLPKVRTDGIRNPLFSWSSSYLSESFQDVNIRGCFSHCCAMASEVIQGSILGTLLYMMYFNDIFKVIRHDAPIPFADYIKIIYSLLLFHLTPRLRLSMTI